MTFEVALDFARNYLDDRPLIYDTDARIEAASVLLSFKSDKELVGRKSEAAQKALARRVRRKLEAGEMPSPELRTWMINHLEYPQKPSRPRITESRMRNVEIGLLVYRLALGGINLSINETSGEQSAFDVVATVLRERGLKPSSYSGVRDIWYAFCPDTRRFPVSAPKE